MSEGAAGLSSTPARVRRRATTSTAPSVEPIPARIMGPRIAFAAAVGALCILGLVMTYSASSIGELIKTDGDASNQFLHQAIGCMIGIVFCAGIALTDYRIVGPKACLILLGIVFVLLVLVLVPGIGREDLGASRRIAIGSGGIQPSEFAKPLLLLIGARICVAHYRNRTLNGLGAGVQALIGIGIPLVLILGQPDKGTVGVIVLTLLIMVFLAGERPRNVLIVFALLGVFFLVWSLKDEYSRARILTMLNPFSDADNGGYQLVQGFYALGTGGFFGLGLGMSRQKYLYLPMADTDFIFAIIGEELGMVGTVSLLLLFCLILWGGFKIAENANDLLGRLVASGCTVALFVQMLLNVAGVLAVFPLSGKPIPFVSAGMSSAVASFILAGMVLSVSLHSELPQTVHAELRDRMRIAPSAGMGAGVPAVLEPRPSGYSPAWAQERVASDAVDGYAEPDGSPVLREDYEEPSVPAFRVVEGGRSRSARTERPARRVAVRPNGRQARPRPQNTEDE